MKDEDAWLNRWRAMASPIAALENARGWHRVHGRLTVQDAWATATLWLSTSGKRRGGQCVCSFGAPRYHPNQLLNGYKLALAGHRSYLTRDGRCAGSFNIGFENVLEFAGPESVLAVGGRNGLRPRPSGYGR